MTQASGRRTSLTFSTALRPGGARFLRAFFFVARHQSWVTAPLRRLEVIQFARWSIVERFPGPQGRRPPRPLLVFHSNFDSDLRSYIEVFAQYLPVRFRLVWNSSAGYPGLVPTEGFHRWVSEQEPTPGYYWSAYDAASTAMVQGARHVAGAVDELAARAAELDDDAFAAAYRQLLIEVQPWL